MTQKIEGQLEIDAARGVIYFHSNKTGVSVLRISGLPTPVIEVKDGLGVEIDINVKAGVAHYEKPIVDPTGNNFGRKEK